MSMGDVVILREEVAPKRQVARPQEHPAHADPASLHSGYPKKKPGVGVGTVSTVGGCDGDCLDRAR